MATITTINGTDLIRDSRAVINTNFSNLNTDKIEAATTATLTNKTINLSSNTLIGTLAQFNTALSGDDFVSLTGTEVLTNKTLTTPIINAGSDANGDIYYRSGTTFTRLPIGTAAQVLTVAAGFPSWATPSAGGTVTSVSVVTANGLAGTVATATTTPAITLSTTVTGVLKGNGTAISAAVAGTDYTTTTSTESFTNKTVNLTSNTLSGTTAQFNTALSDDDFATLTNTVTLTNKTLTAPRIVTGGFISDENGNEQITFTTTASAVNEVNVTNAATGNNPTIQASGETNVGLDLKGKGTKGVTAKNAFVETVFALTDGATPALDASLANIFTLSAAGDRTIAVPTNATSGQKIIIRHFASGGARTLALNTGAGGFRFGTDITALTLTASGKTDYIGCIFNGTDSFWDVIAYIKGF